MCAARMEQRHNEREGFEKQRKKRRKNDTRNKREQRRAKIKICNERRLEIKTAGQKLKDGAGRRRGETPQYQVYSGVTLILLVLISVRISGVGIVRILFRLSEQNISRITICNYIIRCFHIIKPT